MADRFFDTSAAAKHYRVEVGTAKVDAFLAETGARHFLSDLSVVELHSVFLAWSAPARSRLPTSISCAGDSAAVRHAMIVGDAHVHRAVGSESSLSLQQRDP